MENRRGGKSKSRSREDRKFKKRDADTQGGGFHRGGGHRPQRITIPKGTDLSYKNTAFLQKCLTDRGKLFSRRLISGTARQQRMLSAAVKRARFLGLLPSGASRKK